MQLTLFTMHDYFFFKTEVHKWNHVVYAVKKQFNYSLIHKKIKLFGEARMDPRMEIIIIIYEMEN